MINEKLKRLLQSAANNSEYYSDLFCQCDFDPNNFEEKDFHRIPVLTREKIVTNRDRILYKEYQYVNRKELLCERTSGSTGKYVEVLWNHMEFLQSNMCLWRKRKEWYGISAADKKCTFFTKSRSKDKIIVSKNSMEFSSIYMSEQDIEKYCAQIKMFQPKWLMLSPSIALILIEFCKERDIFLPDSIAYVELFGENVSSAAYRQVSDYFKVPTAIMYGAKEVNGIGLTCPCGNMHILEDNVYVEKGDGQKLLITSLKNTVFPIIRYDIGDWVKIEVADCPCESGNQLVKGIYGKDHYLSYLDKASGITTSLLKQIINDVDATFDFPILQVQISYENDMVNIYLYCKKEYFSWQETIRKEFYKQLRHYKMAQANYRIIFYNHPIPYNLYTGKLPLLQFN